MVMVEETRHLCKSQTPFCFAHKDSQATIETKHQQLLPTTHPSHQFHKTLLTSFTMTDNHLSIGQERLKSDTRQIAGFLILVSTCALIFPMADIASLVGPNGTTASEGIGLSALIGSIFVVIMGILGIVIGYLQAIHDYGHKYLTGFFLAFVQLAWMVSPRRRIRLPPTILFGLTYSDAFFLIVLFP